MTQSRIDNEEKIWVIAPGLERSARHNTNNQQFTSNINSDRSRTHSLLHQDRRVNDQTGVSDGLRSNLTKAQELLITEPRKTIQTIFRQIYNNGTKLVSDTLNSSDPSKTKIKQYGLLGVSILFVIGAIRSSLNFLNSLWSNNGKSNLMLGLADTFMKWVVGVGIWYAAINTQDKAKLSSMPAILTGAGLSLLLGQLKGLADGTDNLLSRASKIVGVHKSLTETTNNLGGLI